MHLYVYYDVAGNETARVRELIESMQQRLAVERGHRGRLMRRVKSSGATATWMEIYERVDHGFETHLEAAFERSGVRELLAGPRHIERFEDFD